MNFGEEAPASVGHLVSDPNGMAINAVRTEGPANRIFNNTVPVLYGLSRAYSHQHHADAVLAGRTAELQIEAHRNKGLQLSFVTHACH